MTKSAVAGEDRQDGMAIGRAPAERGLPTGRKIWVDLDNTPHVPFFRPVVRELERRGHAVSLTARDAFQVGELAARAGLDCTRIGRHYGKSRVLKVLGVVWRSVQLLPFVLRERPTLAVSHGSRSQILVCNALRIPCVMIMDYEHAKTPMGLRPRWEIVPEALASERLHCKSASRIRTYSGIKEDVYAAEFVPDMTLGEELRALGAEVLVTVRPPADEAHYHNSGSDDLFVRLMQRLIRTPGVKAVLLPRNGRQETALKNRWPEWFEGSTVTIPRHAVDGLSLVWYSDLVVSGGGTMNREAATLGVPVYSIFLGKSGAVDRRLAQEGRLTIIGTAEEVERRIALVPRRRLGCPAPRVRRALAEIVQHVEEIMRIEGGERCEWTGGGA